MTWWDKEPIKMPLSSFLLGIDCWTCSVPLRVVFLPSEIFWRELNYHSQVGINWREILGWEWGLGFMSFFSCSTPMDTGWVHVSVDACVYIMLIQKTLSFILLWPPFSLALTLILPPLPQGSLSPEVRDLMKLFRLGFRVWRSLSLCTMFRCGFLYSLPSVAS